ncbi:GGDEF domain-containing protein [Larsenimonas suaedae]|uniref:diguanylate cyclase n=1 Tax=Larsenimonas suaedae TaxID=1851019 RepID=A0ABU1GU15_9GAMM|nr:GGDEF domain-containing protein [Larsenimonas suaedae]MCM2972124.1 GGDEF domain-containing protein [Larsenimonas suaedae]MDR5895082.1 GGDEF domain-containing protein [Larsenimonas suaedae]
MNDSSAAGGFKQWLMRAPGTLSARENRSYEVFVWLHLILIVDHLVFFLPVYTWLGQPVVAASGGASLLVSVLSFLSLRRGHVDVACLMLPAALLGHVTAATLHFGLESGFMVAVLLSILLLFMSEFPLFIKSVCSCGFLMVVVGTFIMLTHWLPIAPLGFDQRQFLWLLNLLNSGVVVAAMLYRLSAVTLRFERMYQRSANRDSLTNVLNRRGVMAEGERCQRSGLPYAVLLVDVDHFKSINDTYGHACGDDVLRHLARLMTQSVREGDAIGRVGGEEFLVLLQDLDGHGADFIAERLRQRLEKTPCRIKPGVSVQVTASIGTACSRQVTAGLGAIIEQADARLYEAKRRGRNRVVGAESESDIMALDAE